MRTRRYGLGEPDTRSPRKDRGRIEQETPEEKQAREEAQVTLGRSPRKNREEAQVTLGGGKKALETGSCLVVPFRGRFLGGVIIVM